VLLLTVPDDMLETSSASDREWRHQSGGTSYTPASHQARVLDPATQVAPAVAMHRR
jgi:hypothetical protein